MQQIFIREDEIIENQIRVTGEDAKHLGRVLRMKVGEKLRLSTDADRNFICEVSGFEGDDVMLSVVEESSNTEMVTHVTLFQAIPKGDRMETVIEKTVELGVARIVPVEMKYCVVKLDDKKKKSRVERWQKIADSAARQSKRSRIPEVSSIMRFQDALEEMKKLDLMIVPYENALGMRYTKEVLSEIKAGQNIGILIGPEGGFAEEEINQCREFAKVVSLGKRILRTDTAAITAASLVMMESEYLEQE